MATRRTPPSPPPSVRKTRPRVSAAPRGRPPARSRQTRRPGRPSPGRTPRESISRLGSLPPAPARSPAPRTHHRLPAPRDPRLPPSSNLAATARGASPAAARAQQRAAGAPCAWVRGSGCGSRSECGGRCGRRGSPARGSIRAGAAPPHLPIGAAHGPALAARRHQVIPQEASAIG